ncbi:hypothetical protein [Nocardia tengchongensis]|uniref:hypothetical protein n=1 Tax=Nocardia tengchongensis TaxID=2055889 RepID=UPI0036C50C0D
MAEHKVPRGTMPWLSPTGFVAQEALDQLDRPLLAWRTGESFDADLFYSDWDSGPLTAPEREAKKLGERPEWRMERVWLPDGEESEQERKDYNAGCREIAGMWLHPRCLDAYADIAYAIAGSDDDPDIAPADEDCEALTGALQWAEAGICVLQQSLPFPFLDCLNYRELDNRPAHRIVFAYASILHRLRPRKALPWFRAQVYMSPDDGLGARFYFSTSKRGSGSNY